MGMKRMINGKTVSAWISCNWHDERSTQEKTKILVYTDPLIKDYDNFDTLGCVFDIDYKLIGYSFYGKKSEFVRLSDKYTKGCNYIN